jgi:hypothetical protein
MTLRGEIEAFPLETVVQLIHSTSKTGQLEVRGNDSLGGTLGFDGGRLVAAVAGDDVGEPALGSVFAVASGAFEFIPWSDAPAANLSGDLDQLLDKAAQERDRFIAIRKIIPDDRSRFRLSERAAEKGQITLSPEQWRTLLAVNGDRDVTGVAQHLKGGKLATRASLAALVEAGFVDVVAPAAAAPPPPPTPAPAPQQAAAPEQWSPPAEVRVAPAPEVQTDRTWAPSTTAAPSQSWERPAPAPQSSTAETDLREDLAAALDARLGSMPAPVAEPEGPSIQDERLAALGGVFNAAPPAAETAPPAAETAPVAEAAPRERINEWSRLMPEMQAEPAGEDKKKGLFGFLKREEPARIDPVAPGTAMATATATGRAGRLASLANALLGEYNNGQYGKGRLDDRMANLLMRVDEQADPIDRPLPIVDDRIDAQALDRENVPEGQSVPYLAILVSQIYEDAERTFGKDKAKRGYKAAQHSVFGSDASALNAPDVAARLPKV